MSIKEKVDSSWTAKLKRRKKFCERFVREHHPGMADAHKIKGAHPHKPLDGPAYLRDGSGKMAADWWPQTDDSISALCFVAELQAGGRHSFGSAVSPAALWGG